MPISRWPGAPTPPFDDDEAIVRDRDAAHVIATWRNDVLVVWRGATTSDAINRLCRILTEVNDEQGEKVGLLQYVFEDAPLPFDKEVREAISRMLSEARVRVACSCMIAPGTGFRIATGRAIVTGIAMLARPGFPHVIFPTVEEAAEWQHRLLPRTRTGAVSASQLVGHTQRLIASMELKSTALGDRDQQRLPGP